MNSVFRLVLVNTSIALGLLIMYARGSGIVPVVVSGVFLLVLANILMAVKRREKRNS
jgi:hypothetical protein